MPGGFADQSLSQQVELILRHFCNRIDYLGIDFYGYPRPSEPLSDAEASRMVACHLSGDPPLGWFRISRQEGPEERCGLQRLGVYCIDLDSNTKWLCIDLDGPKAQQADGSVQAHSNPLASPLEAVRQSVEAARELGLAPYVELSKSGSGYHLWVFFNEPIPARLARAIGRLIVPDDVPLLNGGMADYSRSEGIEIFPKQDELYGSFGNQVWLPLFYGDKGGRGRFHEVSGGSPRMIAIEGFTTATLAQVEAIIAERGFPEEKRRGPRYMEGLRAGGGESGYAGGIGGGGGRGGARGGFSDPVWVAWREEALRNLDLGLIYGDIIVHGGRSSRNHVQAKDFRSPTGDRTPSASICTGWTHERGMWHSFRDNLSLSVFDYLIVTGQAQNFTDALQYIARASNTPLPDTQDPFSAPEPNDNLDAIFAALDRLEAREKGTPVSLPCLIDKLQGEESDVKVSSDQPPTSPAAPPPPPPPPPPATPPPPPPDDPDDDGVEDILGGLIQAKAKEEEESLDPPADEAEYRRRIASLEADGVPITGQVEAMVRRGVNPDRIVPVPHQEQVDQEREAQRRQAFEHAARGAVMANPEASLPVAATSPQEDGGAPLGERPRSGEEAKPKVDDLIRAFLMNHRSSSRPLYSVVTRGSQVYRYEHTRNDQRRGVDYPYWRQIGDIELQYELHRMWVALGGETKESVIKNALFGIKSHSHVSNLEDNQYIRMGNRIRDPIEVADGQFIATKSGVICLNDVVDRDTVRVLRHSAGFFCTSAIPYDFIPGAKPLRWLKFMSEVTDGDKDLEMILQEYTGYCLMYGNAFHTALFLVGGGSNGKSVFLKVVKELLGGHNVSHVALSDFSQRFALYPMMGMLANIEFDVGDFDPAGEHVLKKLVVGDEIQVDQKFKDPVSYTSGTKLIFAANKLPHVFDKSDGVFRRFLVVPFNRVFNDEDRDPYLVEKLRGEMPGIFNWALDGLRRCMKRGSIHHCEASNQALLMHRLALNTARSFLDECCIIDEESGVSVALLWSEYLKWCVMNKRAPLNNSNFLHELKGHYHPRYKDLATEGKDKARQVDGLRLAVEIIIKGKSNFETRQYTGDGQDVAGVDHVAGNSEGDIPF